MAATKFVAKAGAGTGEVVARALVFFRTKHWLNAVAAFRIPSDIANHTTCWVAQPAPNIQQGVRRSGLK
jgi:hypothetical protein